MTATKPAETLEQRLLRLLDRTLGAMNKAIEITTEHGPHTGMEYIADYLNETDGVDNDVLEATPGDWLTRWAVTKQ